MCRIEVGRARATTHQRRSRVDDGVRVSAKKRAAHQHDELLACWCAGRIAKLAVAPQVKRLDVRARLWCRAHIPELVEAGAALVGGKAAPQQLAAHLDIETDHVRFDETAIRLESQHR